MAKSKPVRKPKTGILAKIASFERSMADKVVVFVTGHLDVCRIINYKTMREVQVNQKMYDSLHNIRFHWTMHLCVFGTKPSGDYLEHEIHRVNTRSYQRELVDYFNVEHQNLIAGFSKTRIVSAGWAASPCRKELDEKTLLAIFGLLKAWSPSNEPTNTISSGNTNVIDSGAFSSDS